MGDTKADIFDENSSEYLRRTEPCEQCRGTREIIGYLDPRHSDRLVTIPCPACRLRGIPSP